MRDESDAVLAERASGGDRRALEVLLDRHADRVHAVCRRIVAHPEDALDATQEAMIAIARGIRRFDGRAAFTTWCYRVATNAALDELRRKRRRPLPASPDRPEPAALEPSTVSGAPWSCCSTVTPTASTRSVAASSPIPRMRWTPPRRR